MKENKGTIIGFVLMTLVFVGYLFYANHQAKKQHEVQMAAQVEQLAEQASRALESSATVASADATQTKSDAPVKSTLVGEADKINEVVVENDLMQVRFSTLGAQIIDVVLKDYTKYAPKEERNELRERMEKMARSFMDWRIEADNDRSEMKLSIAKLGRKVEMMAPFMCGDLSCKLRKRVVLSDEGEVKEDDPHRKRRQPRESKDIEPIDIKDM